MFYLSYLLSLWLLLAELGNEFVWAQSETSAPQVGLTYTGGGIPGILEALCTHEALSRLVPEFHNLNITVSTASGGALGYLLSRSSNVLEFPPDLTPNLTYAELASTKSRPGYIWWATVVDWLPQHMSPGHRLQTSSANPFIGSAFSQRGPNPQQGWWQDVMRLLFRVPYRVPAGKEGHLGVGDHIQQFAVIEQEGCLPMTRDASGYMVGAKGCLHFANLEARSLPTGLETKVQVAGDLTFASSSQRGFSLIDGAAWTSSFYASSIIESSSAYRYERWAEVINKGALISTMVNKSNSSQQHLAHIIDGGFIDSTGIVSQLQRRTRRIFVVYGVNRCISGFTATNQCENATIATLFGLTPTTDSMDSLAGRFVQVFDSSLYKGVYANLTDHSNLRARLTQVKVMKNDYLQVEPYVLDELVILSNARSQGFMDYFSDPDIGKHIDDHWPDRFALSMDAFNANMVCQNQRWKLQHHADEIKSFFSHAQTDANVFIV